MFRKKLCRTLEELQADLDTWLENHNKEMPHSGRNCYGKTPWEISQQSRYLALENNLSRESDQPDNRTLQLSTVR